MKLTRENSIAIARARFPGLAQVEANDDLHLYDDLPWPFFSIVFGRYIYNSQTASIENRKEIAAFLEELIAADDFFYEVVKIDLAFEFLKSQEMLDAYYSLLGPKVQHLVWWLAPKFAPQIIIPA
jgi:hypothetical protein